MSEAANNHNKEGKNPTIDWIHKEHEKMRESINGQFNLHRDLFFSGFCLQIKQDQRAVSSQI